MVFVSGNSRVWFRMEGYEALECLSREVHMGRAADLSAEDLRPDPLERQHRAFGMPRCLHVVNEVTAVRKFGQSGRAVTHYERRRLPAIES